jgi:dTDP-4-amino-4,6-dideoxygalactose transaminase
VYHQFTLRTRQRKDLHEHLGNAGIGSGIYYPLPLHLQPALEQYAPAKGSLPEAEAASETVLSLPMFPELTEEEVQETIEAVQSFFASTH